VRQRTRPVLVAGPRPAEQFVEQCVDGLRGDYVDVADVPFLDRVMQEGAYTRHLAPVFPSLTFPSHVSMATGTLVKDHGIAANALWDFDRDRRWSYPSENSTLRSEAIWNTTSRQGIRTLVFDWPVSQRQKGPYAADYFTNAYDTSIPDERRLERLTAFSREVTVVGG
jgi:predicted AlkP superfamily pyrophosphatase or phosphodiesterase